MHPRGGHDCYCLCDRLWFGMDDGIVAVVVVCGGGGGGGPAAICISSGEAKSVVINGIDDSMSSPFFTYESHRLVF